MVSIIIPNYNHAQYLKQRIEIFLNQTYQDFEVILLDDCSTDNSRDILLSYIKHPKVTQVVFNEQNSGSTFKQWKKGIGLARGEYIWIAESDDWCELNFLEQQLFHFNENVGIVYCESNHIDSEGNIIYHQPLSSEIVFYKGNDFIKDQMVYGNSIYNASMAVFKKELFYKIREKGYLKMKYCGDWFFWSLLLHNTNIIRIFYPYNYFRRHDKSVSTKSELSGLSIIEGSKVLKLNFRYLNDSKKRMICWYWLDKIHKQQYDTSIRIHIYWNLLINLPDLFFMMLKIDSNNTLKTINKTIRKIL